MEQAAVRLVPRGHFAEKFHRYRSVREAAAFLATEVQGRWIVILGGVPLVPLRTNAESIEREMVAAWVLAL